jgi:hypothetical protein
VLFTLLCPPLRSLSLLSVSYALTTSIHSLEPISVYFPTPMDASDLWVRVESDKLNDDEPLPAKVNREVVRDEKMG